MSRQKQYRNNDLIQKIGMRIREIRESKGMSQQLLADVCELELSQINRIELGKINTSVSHLHLIAEKLEVPMEALLKPGTS